MIITKLILHNYKRMFLNDITHIAYTPKSNIQILLGQNGSGKSSLLEQLTPLPPAIKKDFKDSGYKEIYITHNDQNYILRSELGSGHSFKLDNIELNTSGTISVQIQLVEYHFGITPHIQQVLIGKKQFTNMSYTERKRWVSEMSSIDYSYPIMVYNKLKQRYRDIVGSIKHLQANIVKVKNTTLPDDVINSLIRDRKHFIILIDHMLTLIDHTVTVGSLDSSVSSVESIVSDIGKMTSYTDTLDSMKDTLSKYIAKLELTKEYLKSLYSDLSDLTKQNNLGNSSEYISSKKEIESQIDGILSKHPLRKLTDIESIYKYVNDNYMDMVSLVSKLDEFSGLDITKKDITSINSKLASLETSIYNYTKRINKLEERVEHLKMHASDDNLVECPKCTHKWNPEYSKEEYDNCLLELSKYSKLLESSKDSFNKLTDELDNIKKVRLFMEDFFKYFNYSSDTRYILEYIRTSPEYKSSGYLGLFHVFERVCSELKTLYPIISLRSKLSEVNAKLLEIEQAIVITKTNNDNTLNTIKCNIENTRNSIRILENNIKNISKDISSKVNRDSKINELKRLIKVVYSIKNNNLVFEQNNELKKGISILREELVSIDNNIRLHNERETLLIDYQKDLDDLNNREKLLKITLNELSPNQGLIAKSISSFLNKFIQDINSVISTIWGYDMEILSCDLGNDDLDYRFRVLVNNDETIEDISKTSSGMQEIINLAFKVVFCRYMGFIGYPLTLDEFGGSFDAHHRITAYEALQNTIINDFSQVFIVSHFESMYGRFGNADVSILGTVGVDTDTIKKYNEVVHIS